ncbi:MAG: hypothetical protein ACXVFK_09245 [Solirubrobacteraceae bacterium]
MASFEWTWTNPTTSLSLPPEIRVFNRDLAKLPQGGVAIGGAVRLVFDGAGNLVAHEGPDTATERAQLCTALGA